LTRRRPRILSLSIYEAFSNQIDVIKKGIDIQYDYFLTLLVDLLTHVLSVIYVFCMGFIFCKVTLLVKNE
jgi:hypothetical protein